MQILDRHPLAAVITSGHTSDYYPLFWGTREGCPFSLLLFAIAIEPFVQMMRREDMAVSEVSLGGKAAQNLLICGRYAALSLFVSFLFLS